MILGTLHRLQNDTPGDLGSTPTDTPPTETTVDNSLPDFRADPPAPDPAPAPAPAVDPMADFNKLVDTTLKGETTDRPRDAMGRFVATAAEQAAGIDPNAAPAKPAAKPETPPADDLTPPEGLSERARDRFTQMAAQVKQLPELERRATEAETQLGEVRQLVASTGMSAEEFSDVLGVLRQTRSNNPEDLQAALARIDAMRSDLALRLGRDVPAVDPLDRFPDLKGDVANMLLTRERALEIASLRQKGQTADTMTAEQQDFARHQQAVQTASTQMQTALESRKHEPGHESKMKAISAYFADEKKKQAFVTTYRPDQWAAALTLMYDNLGVQAPPAPAPAGPQPLRPGNVRSGAPVVTGPVTAQSALQSAFAAAGL